MAINTISTPLMTNQQNPVLLGQQAFQGALGNIFALPMMQQHLQQAVAASQIAAAHARTAAGLVRPTIQHMQASVSAQAGLAAQHQAAAGLYGAQAKQVAPTAAAKRQAIAATAAQPYFAHPIAANVQSKVNPVVQNLQKTIQKNTPGSQNTNQNMYAMNKNQMQAYYNNPNIPVSDKINNLRAQAEYHYNYNHGKNAWSKLSPAQKNNHILKFGKISGLE